VVISSIWWWVQQLFIVKSDLLWKDESFVAT
jgi:hypothetical protein